MKKLIVNTMLVAMMFIGIFTVIPVSTAGAADCPNQNVFLPSWYDGMCDGKGNIESPNKGGGSAEQTGNNIGGWLARIALNIVSMILTAVAYISLAFIIFGGFKFMISGDNSSGTQSARKTITNAVIGLILSILSVAIVKFVTSFV